VLANRLSQDSACRVLLLEAGGWDWNPLIAAPLAARLVTALNLHNWDDVSEPDPGLNGHTNLVPHGKVIGGTSSINYMAHTRGHPNDYARWVAQGATGWSYDEVLPFFKACETWEWGADAWRGGEGELGVQEGKANEPIYDAWFQAARSQGYELTPDFNGQKPEGIGKNQYTVRDGKRASSARMFLRPALKRPNLTVRTRTHVTKLLFEGTRVTGVEFQTRQGRETARSLERTVLCLGAINTPHLLMLSGIGPANHLRTMGVKPLVDLPVGGNLEDHLGFAIFWSRKETGTFHRLLRIDRVGLAMLQAYFLGTGPATSPPGVLMGYVKTEPHLPQPDIELLLQLPPANADYWFPGYKEAYEDGFGVRAYLTGQQSRGEILLRSADPKDRPRIFYNSLSAPGDLAKLREAYKRAWALGSSAELAPYRSRFTFPGTELSSDGEIDAFIRENARQQYHPGATCRMGAGENAVLNPDLSVRGVEGLNVVDASAMPSLVSGNPNVVIMMMAARAASLWRP
jgi:choline dehydrogenase-like flavoprotein